MAHIFEQRPRRSVDAPTSHVSSDQRPPRTWHARGASTDGAAGVTPAKNADRILWHEVASDVTRTLSSDTAPYSNSPSITPRRRRSFVVAGRRVQRNARRFLPYAFVWTGPAMAGFIVSVRQATGAALHAAAEAKRPDAPRSSAVRAALEHAVIEATVQRGADIVATLMWLWKAEGRDDFQEALQRHVRYLPTWRAAVATRAQTGDALSAAPAAFSLLELADNAQGRWWRRPDFCGLRAISARPFDFRRNKLTDNMARTATAAESGAPVSCAAMLLLLDVQDSLHGALAADVALYVNDLYCAHALKSVLVVGNSCPSTAPWHSSSCPQCAVPCATNTQRLVDALEVGADPDLRARIFTELAQSAPPVRLAKAGRPSPVHLSDADRAAELVATLRDTHKRARLLASNDASPPLLLVSRFASWRTLDDGGSFNVRAVRAQLGAVTLMSLSKEDLHAPRACALGVDVDRADKRAESLWCSRNEVRVRNILGVAQRALRTPDDMRRYLAVPSLETYVALSEQHAPWAAATNVGYARGEWNGPIALQGLAVAKAMHALILLPVSKDTVFSVLDWELRKVSAAVKGRIQIHKRALPVNAVVDRLSAAKRVFTGAPTEMYI